MIISVAESLKTWTNDQLKTTTEVSRWNWTNEPQGVMCFGCVGRLCLPDVEIPDYPHFSLEVNSLSYAKF